jgi:hypothetical protein
MIPQETRDFLEALGYFSRYDRLHVRAFSAKKMPMDERLKYDTAFRKQGQILPLSPMGSVDLNTLTYYPVNGKDKGRALSNAWSQLQAINKKPQGVYFTVNPGGQVISDITEACVLFYEIDNCSKEEQWAKLKALQAELGCTLMVVETKNSLHVYLLLAEPIIDLALWTKYQQRLIQKMDSDISIHNWNRVMRVPGFDYWAWDDVANVPVNHGPIKLRQLGDRILLSEIDAVLPGWETTRWSPPTDRPVVNPSGDDSFLDYWNILNYAHYLPGYNAKGRQGGWATAQCPNQGAGHSSNPSLDSLHIAPNGAIKCQAGCDDKDVIHAAIAYACTMGYPTLESWAKAKGLWREKRAPLELPSAEAAAPPETEFPVELISVGKLEAAVESLPSGSTRPDAPIDLGEPPDYPVLVSEPLVPIPEADNPELAYHHDQVKGDGKGTTLLGAAIRSLELSPEGLDIVSRYCWVFVKNEYFDLKTHAVIKGGQLSDLHDHRTGFFKRCSNWVQLPQGDKPKKVGVIDLLRAHDCVVFDYGYAPGEASLIPPAPGEDLPRANLWKPPPKGTPNITESDVAIWLERLYNLMPGEAGAYFLQYLAHTVQRPEEKADFAPLLYTQKRRTGREQLIKPVLEMFNAVDQGCLVFCSSYDPRYTEDMMGKRLVIVNELKKPNGKEFPDPNHWLKNHIGHSADSKKIYTRKGLSSVLMPDFANFILLTNEQDAITIMEDEGRYWPIETTWKGPEKDYTALAEFYKQGGYAKIWAYLYTVDLTGFSPWRPRLELSNFTEFCGATEGDARMTVLDILNTCGEPVMSHHDLKQTLSDVEEVQDGRPLRKLLANSDWKLGSDRNLRVYQKGEKRVASHLIHQRTLTTAQARELWLELNS